MTVKIPKSALGISGNDFTINFSWTDNVHDEGDYTKYSGDIMDFYISGDVAPGGRFKYSYISTQENSGAPIEPEETTTEETTVVETETTVETSVEDTTDDVTAGESTVPGTTEENTTTPASGENNTTTIPEDSNTDTDTTPDTPADTTEAITEEGSDSAPAADDSSNKKGCKSVVGITALIPVALIGVAYNVRKKKEN